MATKAPLPKVILLKSRSSHSFYSIEYANSEIAELLKKRQKSSAHKVEFLLILKSHHDDSSQFYFSMKDLQSETSHTGGERDHQFEQLDRVMLYTYMDKDHFQPVRVSINKLKLDQDQEQQPIVYRYCLTYGFFW